MTKPVKTSKLCNQMTELLKLPTVNSNGKTVKNFQTVKKTYVMQPLDFVGSWVCLDGAVQVDVVPLGDAQRVNVLAQGKLNFGRICEQTKSQKLKENCI